MCPENVDNRFAKRQASCLVSNQGAEEVSWFEHRSNRRTDRFLSFTQIDAACNFASPPQTSQFFFDCPRKEHPFKRRYVEIRK